MKHTISVTYKIPLELKEQLQEVSDKKGLSMNTLIISYISQGLKSEFDHVLSQNQ